MQYVPKQACISTLASRVVTRITDKTDNALVRRTSNAISKCHNLLFNRDTLFRVLLPLVWQEQLSRYFLQYAQRKQLRSAKKRRKNYRELEVQTVSFVANYHTQRLLYVADANVLVFVRSKCL